MKGISPIFPILLATAFTAASAYTVSGTVKDNKGMPFKGAKVSLLKEQKETTTGDKGEFYLQGAEDSPGDSITTPPDAIRSAALPGYISINSGILSYSQGGNAPVNVRIFDLMGNEVFKQSLYGSGQVDLTSGVKAKGMYFAQVTAGSAKQTLRFTSNGNYSATFGEDNRALLKQVQPGETLRVVADGFDTLNVPLGTLDTTLELTLTAAATEQTPAFGWEKKNDPVPSSGCGKDPQLSKSGQFKFTWTYKGESTTRDVYYDIPSNYDKNKPYRLVFGMQCMNGSAQNVARNENYYGMKPLDTESSTIFVAPDGKCHSDNCPPWEERDYAFFDELLAKLESELCIDSSRVFSSGFSYGSMFTNGLSRNHQHVLRAVAVYETADVNIWLPDVVNKPIAWMGVHGLSDNLCTPAMGRSARDTALKNASAEGKDATKEKAQESNSGQHVCYDYKDVDPRFPVKWCTDNANHQWDHRDPGQRESWVPKTTWEFFTQF
jgi:poly(3-hydroxybutyrate) depolymerase